MVKRRGRPDRARRRRAGVVAGIAFFGLTTLAVSSAAARESGMSAIVPTTVPPSPAPADPTATTTVATPAPESTLATATTVTLPRPENEAADPIRTLVPIIAVVSAVLTDAADRDAAIGATLANGGTTVAVPAEPGTLCAVIPLLVPLMAESRWERNGEPIGTGTEQRRDPPGFGECIIRPNGEAFDEGVYQYVAVGPTGATSAAASVVVGVEPVDTWFVNNGDEPVCLVLLSPTRADFYEGHDTDTPLLPGEAISISAAAIENDVRVLGCPPDETLRTFTMTPEPLTYVELFDHGTSTTTTPTTTPNTT